uniref:Lipase n=1 Tax=Panagrolaimus sp. ES5 TaxID=591445 RepID=A0AC34FKP6_9BILA
MEQDVHGNSDGALSDHSKYGTGWSKSITYLTSKNYSTATLYATTWGDRIALNAYTRTHSCEVITRIRTFIEAVLEYTGAPQVHVISHSMGVAIARKAIRGGYIDADDGICNVGSSLRSRINTFIGISGANYGMCQCSGGNTTAIYPTCNKKNGFWPGEPCGIYDSLTAQELCGGPIRACSRNAYSQLLQEMNEDSINEGSYVFSFWSFDDDLINFHDSVYGRPTSFVPFSNATKVFRGMDHMTTKDGTPDVQYKLLKAHKF